MFDLLATIVFAPDHGDAGVYELTVTASDGNLEATTTFTLTVTPVR